LITKGDCTENLSQQRGLKQSNSWHSKLYWSIKDKKAIKDNTHDLEDQLFGKISSKLILFCCLADWQCHVNPWCHISQGMAVQTPFLKKPKISTLVYTHKVLLEVCLINQFTWINLINQYKLINMGTFWPNFASLIVIW